MRVQLVVIGLEYNYGEIDDKEHQRTEDGKRFGDKWRFL